MSRVSYKFEDGCGYIDYNKVIILGHGERLGFREEFKELYFNEVEPSVSLTINCEECRVFSTNMHGVFAIIPWDYVTRVELFHCECGRSYDTDTMGKVGARY